MIGSIVHPMDVRRRRKGFLLLEVILGIALFGVFLTAATMTLLHGQQNTAAGGDRVRATHAALQAMEASRSIRDGAFSALTAGAHGFRIGPARTWVYSGSQVTVSGGYVTKVTVTTLASDWVRLQTSTKWKHGIGRSGSILLTGELTDWRTTRSTGDWGSLTVEGSYVDAGTPLFNDVAVSGNYAFVTSETSSGGAGLYVFDITSLSSPTRVSSSFTLGAAGYGVAVRGDTLYVATSSSSEELRAYDISDPTALTSGDLVASRNLSASNLITSMALRGNLLLVGAQQHASHPEVYLFAVTSTGFTLLSSSDHGATVNAVALTDTGAFLATADSTAEMRTLIRTSTGGLRAAPSPDANLTSTEAGRAVLVFGTSAILGRTRGTSIQEMVLLDTRNGGGSPPAGVLYHEGSGSVVALDTDSTACQAFLAADSSGKAVQVVHLWNPGLPELASYDSTSGPARGLQYDPARDRLFVLTRKGFLIFQPGATPIRCP